MKYFLQKIERDFEKTFGWFLCNGRKIERRKERFEEKYGTSRYVRHVAVTGGAGFIGSHLVKLLYEKGYVVTVIDNLSYAGSLDNLGNCIKENHDDPNNHDSPFVPCGVTRVKFEKIDIRNLAKLKKFFEGKKFDAIVHLAAESHVDRSIDDPMAFVKTNVEGTVNLLEIAVQQHRENPGFVFYHVSTDEVFGSLDLGSLDKFDESTPYDPRSPYSASKASSDHFVRAYHHTYNLPVLISNCSNNYGTHQYPEKLIPVVINKLIKREPIPVYGKGINKRDWLHVKDHAEAIVRILTWGKIGETYCVGGNNVISNIDLVDLLCDIYDEMNNTRHSRDLITFVNDRKGHDLKYAIRASKMRHMLGWKPKRKFTKSLREVISWYMNLTAGKVPKVSGVQNSVIRVIAETLGVEVAEVTMESQFAADLGADSIDIVTLTMAFEKEFNMLIADSEAEKFRTVADTVKHVEKALAEIEELEGAAA